MKNVPLTLFTFASQQHNDAISATLGRLGYIINNRADSDWAVTPEHVAKGIAVYLFGESTPPADHICSLLTVSSTHPRLGIFIDGYTSLDARLVCHLDEFSSWPCTDEELNLRLDRLVGNVGELSCPEADRKLLDELFKLNIIGRSPALLRTIRQLKKFSKCEPPVLIEGETGTGKELAARAIHYLSNRRDHPFVPVNCGALAEHLVENELFGHEKGAYTDAGKANPGLIAQAKQGSLFLDEIEALSQKAQVSLLRFLQENEYRPLGSSQALKANVRVIAASNTPIQELVKAGKFRQDLYYRLDIMTIVLPPLRERGEDVKLLAEHFLSLYRSQYNQPEKYLHPVTLGLLGDYGWPGNVRELENMVHRAFLLSDGPVVYFETCKYQSAWESASNDMEKYQYTKIQFSHAKAQVIREFEKCYLENILRESSGNITLAARKAGKERRAFGKLLKKYAINKDSV